MCPSKNNIVLAIYGASCVGKTTLAKELGFRWGVPVRHCGSVLKEHANALKISLENLPAEVHRTVDAETRSLAQQTSDFLIIEGRYLDLVLAETPRVRFVRLECDETVREQRLRGRGNRQAPSMSRSIQQEDRYDAKLQRTLYGDAFSVAIDWMVLDTTRLAPEDLLSAVIMRVQQDVFHD